MIVVAALVGAVGVTVGVVVSSSTAGGRDVPSAIPSMSVFSDPDTVAAAMPDVAPTIGDQEADTSRARVLADGVGVYGSRLIAYPSTTGSRICYGIEAATAAGPAMSYCYEPLASDAPEGIRDQRFDASALYSNLEQGPMVQLFGVAFDDVVAIRVKVAGDWHAVPVADNGFFLELAGVEHADVTTVEATLIDGTTRTQNIQTGT